MKNIIIRFFVAQRIWATNFYQCFKTPKFVKIIFLLLVLTLMVAFTISPFVDIGADFSKPYFHSRKKLESTNYKQCKDVRKSYGIDSIGHITIGKNIFTDDGDLSGIGIYIQFQSTCVELTKTDINDKTKRNFIVKINNPTKNNYLLSGNHTFSFLTNQKDAIYLSGFNDATLAGDHGASAPNKQMITNFNVSCKSFF